MSPQPAPVDQADWQRASIQVLASPSRAQSTVKRKDRPAPAPGRLRERTRASNSSTKRAGMSTLLARSMPRTTPPSTTTPATPMASTW